MATSFAELVSDVMAITNRPSLADLTAVAIKNATLKAHHLDDYIFDFVESGVQFSSSEYLQSFDYKSVFPYWRKPRYLRKYDATGSLPGAFFEILVPEKAVDSYGANREDICYVAGANIQIRSSTQFQYMLVGYYKNPIVTATGFSSWIADDYPTAITYEAAAEIFSSVGYDEQARIYSNRAAEARRELTVHAIT